MTRGSGPLRRTVARLAGASRALTRRWRYRQALASGEPAGDVTWVYDPTPPPPPLVEVRLPAHFDRGAVLAWRRAQTLPELRVVGVARDGTRRWTIDPERDDHGADAAWFAAPGRLPDLPTVHLESSMLVAAAEVVDAVILLEDGEPGIDAAGWSARRAAEGDLRHRALFASESWSWDPATDRVAPRRDPLLVKLIGPKGVGDLRREPATFGEFRRGPYLSDAPIGPLLRVSVRDAGALARRAVPSQRPTVLVTAPFLARGGAEHTLFETMRELADRFDFAIATLAPHRPELGDRRPDFRGLTDRIYSLGDLVHPAAMYGMLLALIDSLDATVLYNANSTTLFYEFAPRLRRDRPRIRVIDHLYDHRIGYIDRYGPELLDAVDACVAENHRIADVLTGERGWPAERVPVIWPCGRPLTAFPPPAERNDVRQEVRRQLGLGADDVVFLTAARMHPQKRPLDLVRLAERVRDLDRVRFLMVGGGDLERDVDRAIEASGAAIRRLPFRTDIPRLIVAADVGCLVSDFEGLPVFLLECLQVGRPFLGTDVGDMGELLRSSGAGIVVEQPGDLAALEDAVRRLAGGELRDRLAERAAAAGARFDPAACAAAYGDAFAGPGR